MKKITFADVISIILILISFGFAIYFYTHFPASVATHFDILGNPNRFSSAGFAAFFIPTITLILYLLITFIKSIDPRKKNYDDFMTIFGVIKVAIVGFLVAVSILMGLNGLGYYSMSVVPIVMGLISLLFIVIGFCLPSIKSNWFVGIRTPWTMSNTAVWDKTHALGRYVFVIGGVLFAFISYLPEKGALYAIIPLIAAIILIPTVYSYLIYRKITE